MAKVPTPLLMVALILVIIQVPILYLLFQSPVREALGNLVFLFFALEVLTTLAVFATVGAYLNRKP